ncbi:hypothetical protein [Dactylosporangium sp. NPDC005555]|uniref:hypothetical protein n=1 Tax=Dactylosporangium sp. NPDC005555 TaxID=3154889 RepID=UPI0033B5D8F0
MYELNRIRLFGVGPRGARYTDVTLDLSGVGRIVPGTGDLFTEPTRRPSPYSLLLLENGGGKSVLLKLLFSVVLPGKRNAVGGSAAVMEKFVIGDDAAHVVLEWMHVRTGEQVITGKTLQRRPKHTTGGRLAEHWWSLRPNGDVTIDSLPFTASGRRLRLDGFREALQEIDRAAPVTQLTWVGSEIGAWVEHLRATGIEPDLFSIQRRMNADEGDAANAFKFNSSKDFVEWLLKVVLDAEDAVSVAENFHVYASTVGDRQAMLLEREFAAEAVAALQPLAAAALRHRAARTAQRTAESDALMLLLRVQAREAAEAGSSERLQALAAQATEAASTRESERDRARDVVNEIRRRTVALEHAAAEEEQREAAEARRVAEADLRGWALAGKLDLKAVAEQKAKALAQQIMDAELTARPALHARDEAAGDLLSKLHAEAEAARRERDRQNRDAGDRRRRAGELDEERTEALNEAALRRAERAAVREKVAKTRMQVDIAITNALLAAGDDVAETAAAAASQADVAERQVEAGEQAVELADRAVRATAQTARDAHDALGRARRLREDADRALQTVVERAAPLTADEIVRVALTADVVDVDMLDLVADHLAEQLSRDEVTVEQRLGGLRDAQRTDQRLLDALGDGGLLPPRAEVEAGLHVLHAAGVGAHAGWRYLAENVPAAERGRTIAAHPQLADGVVVVDQAALRDARDALTAARLLPAAAIAVGTGARMLKIGDRSDDDTESAGDGQQFVVEPNPALFDTEAAERRREQLRETMQSRGVDIHQESTTVEHLRRVRTELTGWRRECPAGRLAYLRADLQGRDEALAAAADEDEAARLAAGAAETLRGQRNTELAGLRKAERAAAERAGALQRLAVIVMETTEEERRLPELDEAIRTDERTVRELTERRDHESEQATEAARTAENAADRAERHQAEMAGVVTSTGERSATAPAGTISDLRAVYQAAAAAFAAVEVGQDLRLTADAAEADAARLRTDVDSQDPTDVERGRQLLASPDGADAAGRQAATARADRERVRHDLAIGAATRKAGELSNELAKASPSDHRNVWIQLPDDRRPTSVAHGRELLTAGAAEHRAAQQRHEEAIARQGELARKVQASDEAAQAFRAVAAPLAAVLNRPDATDTVDAPVTYAGTAEQAQGLTERMRASLRNTMAEERESHAEVTRLVDATVRFANDQKYEAMTNLARRALVNLEREQLAARAGEFATQLEQRLATLTTDLDSAGRHRKMIVDRLAALVDGALKTLRTASRLSRLPAGLGDWEGKEFLRIRFKEPDPSLLAAHVGEVVDEMAAASSARAPAARGTAPKRDGLALLLRCIEMAVPKGFTVDLLKPDSVLRDERVPVEAMNEVFSGGQELTAAIVLYCTMAALRANERGQLRSRHSGVLFLDNPIGKANAEYLLELQQGVAATLGVQLVYTTGLSDDRALAAFPLWVRMRNDADLRAGLKHIRVAEVVRRQLPEQFTDEEEAAGTAPGNVTATRLFRRPS